VHGVSLFVVVGSRSAGMSEFSRWKIPEDLRAFLTYMEPAQAGFEAQANITPGII